MEINGLILLHGNKTFKVDTQDKLVVFMHVDGYKRHVRQNNVSLVQGLSISEFHILVDSFQKA
ncbi:hypothetical protein [Paraglaciecola sp. MB-3u-78]|jgi:hypothetical protein|uniref:hypothetical protein n=1 Tax=Paraglaciecola sp. MB-3u-78 TaxID=2058332 RepID=UPI000C32D940|nr:hypothetical protein [Paraglaciecola sp. MB-3u-78]PKG92903.1 hypothetical protein CXF95_28400 [Paraglaciecola sp. MB-3u-78]